MTVALRTTPARLFTWTCATVELESGGMRISCTVILAGDGFPTVMIATWSAWKGY